MRLKLSPEKREEEARKSLDYRMDFERRTGFADYAQRLAHWDTQWRGLMPRENPPWPP